jgi:hypothetical protein
MSVCMNASGMPAVAISRSSSVSIVQGNMTDSIATVGELVSSLEMYSLCFLPSAHNLALLFFHNVFVWGTLDIVARHVVAVPLFLHALWIHHLSVV